GSGDQVADLLLGTGVKRPERAIRGAVGRGLVLGQPAAGEMDEQIVLGPGIGVDVGEIDPGAKGFYRHPDILPEAGVVPGRGGVCAPEPCTLGPAGRPLPNFDARAVPLVAAEWAPGSLSPMPDDEPRPNRGDDGPV